MSTIWILGGGLLIWFVWFLYVAARESRDPKFFHGNYTTEVSDLLDGDYDGDFDDVFD